MILLLVVLAMADCDLDTSVASVREGGKRQAYDCLIRADEGGSRLVRGLYETPADARLSRALALWMLQRADSPFDPLHAAQLVPADLRLLARDQGITGYAGLSRDRLSARLIRSLKPRKALW